jgi:hypothetical protein
MIVSSSLDEDRCCIVLWEESAALQKPCCATLGVVCVKAGRVREQPWMGNK